MSGKQLGVALGAGFLTGVILYLWDATVGPAVNSAVNGVVGGVTK